MNNLKAGFSRVQITPPMGIDITGYYKVRKAEGVLDDLYANVLALSAGEKTVLLCCLDIIGYRNNGCDVFRDAVSEACGIPREAIFISATHTHTGPNVDTKAAGELEKNYFNWLLLKTCDAAKFALADLKDARMAYGVGKAERISFGRRYLMKDGSCRTNPGVNNPDIVAPIGEVDERVGVVRFDREGAETLVLVNFGTHPDTIGGNLISADWPGFVRKTVEAAIDNTKCIFFNGAQGDVNHVNVMPRPGESNGMFHDFDDVDRGYSHAKHMGNVVAGAVLQIYEKLPYSDVDEIKYVEENVKIPANVPTKEELPLAIKYLELHKAGRDDEIPFKGMALTTEVARATRMVRLKDSPEYFDFPMTAIKLGSVALISIPGEPFTTVGLGLKANNTEFGLVVPCALTNGYKGYFPNAEAYAEGGYESASSNFKAGVAEKIVEEGTKLLKKLL